MKKALVFLAFAGLFAVLSFARSQKESRAQEEQALRKIEAQTAQFEQQNDTSKMGALADDWVCVVDGGKEAVSKAELQQNVKHNFAQHDNGPSPYTIEKKNMRVYFFGNTAVVSYIKEYRQAPDTTKFFDEDDTDVFTRSFGGWHLRFTKIAPAPQALKAK
ncbi:MAG TPA: nuclear transport factor 2 family protein [Candidatus Acidoferrum sp.]|nr:nuclear transport factor 2 family protein [Candidatus Acidoferrum sp.]